MMSQSMCTRAVPTIARRSAPMSIAGTRRHRLHQVAIVSPPAIAPARILALVVAALQSCPEALSCVVAPLVIGSALVFKGFKEYSVGIKTTSTQ